VRIPGGIEGDASGVVAGATAEVSRVKQGRAGRIQFRDERVLRAAERGLDRAGAGARKIRGSGGSGDIRIARGVDGDSSAEVAIATAQIGAIDQRRARWIQF